MADTTRQFNRDELSQVEFDFVRDKVKIEQCSCGEESKWQMSKLFGKMQAMDGRHYWPTIVLICSHCKTLRQIAADLVLDEQEKNKEETLTV